MLLPGTDAAYGINFVCYNIAVAVAHRTTANAAASTAGCCCCHHCHLTVKVGGTLTFFVEDKFPPYTSFSTREKTKRNLTKQSLFS